MARTRDKEKFPLLFKENINYGFRRNLWGMKPPGIATSALGTSSCVAKIVVLAFAAQPLGTTPTIVGGLCFLLLLIWCVRVTPGWVRIPAEGYAKQLVEACESL